MATAPSQWKAPHPTRDESPCNVFDKRLRQAEALSAVLVGEEFSEWNSVIQNSVLELLNDLIVEVRIAAHEMEKADSLNREPHP